MLEEAGHVSIGRQLRITNMYVHMILNICLHCQSICIEWYKYLYRIELRLAGILGRLLDMNTHTSNLSFLDALASLDFKLSVVN